PVERATTLNNLGNALEALPARSPDERAAALDEAIGAFREALTVYTKDRYPVEWATTLNNLGYALLASAARSPEERTAALREAIAAYRDALTVLTKDRHPDKYAKIAANLGSLLIESGDIAEGQRYLESALALREFLLDQGSAIESWLRQRG